MPGDSPRKPPFDIHLKTEPNRIEKKEELKKSRFDILPAASYKHETGFKPSGYYLSPTDEESNRFVGAIYGAGFSFFRPDDDPREDSRQLPPRSAGGFLLPISIKLPEAEKIVEFLSDVGNFEEMQEIAEEAKEVQQIFFSLSEENLEWHQSGSKYRVDAEDLGPYSVFKFLTKNPKALATLDNLAKRQFALDARIRK